MPSQYLAAGSSSQPQDLVLIHKKKCVPKENLNFPALRVVNIQLTSAFSPSKIYRCLFLAVFSRQIRQENDVVVVKSKSKQSIETTLFCFGSTLFPASWLREKFD